MKGRNIPYSAEELAFIEWRQAMSRRALRAAFVARFGRTDVTVEHLKALCTRRGWTTGRTGCFEKGLVPHNKGRKGVCAPGSEKGWFRKGSRYGRAAQLWKPVGSERISKDGYRERKVHDGLPMQSRWRGVQLIEWEKRNGPLPEGYVLKCLDGNRANTDPSNWEAIPRALLPRLSGGRWFQSYESYEPEVRPAVLTIAKLEHEAREVGRRLGGDES